MCVLGGIADKLNWAEFRRPLEDPSGWTVRTTRNDGRVSERPATGYDMAERQYAPFVIAGLGSLWGWDRWSFWARHFAANGLS
jgi:hypothetical protein